MSYHSEEPLKQLYLTRSQLFMVTEVFGLCFCGAVDVLVDERRPAA